MLQPKLALSKLSQTATVHSSIEGVTLHEYVTSDLLCSLLWLQVNGRADGRC